MRRLVAHSQPPLRRPRYSIEVERSVPMIGFQLEPHEHWA